MLIAHIQGGGQPVSGVPATLPAGQLAQIIKILIQRIFLSTGRGLSGQKHVLSLTAGTNDARWNSAWQRKQARAGRGVEDRLGIDAVGTVKISDVAGLSKAVDAQRDDRVAADGAEPR